MVLGEIAHGSATVEESFDLDVRGLDHSRVHGPLFVDEGGERGGAAAVGDEALVAQALGHQGDFMAVANSLDRTLSTASGSLAGPHSPYHVTMSNPGIPDSATVGTLGMEGRRALVVTASALSLPPATCG